MSKDHDRARLVTNDQILLLGSLPAFVAAPEVVSYCFLGGKLSLT